MAIDLAFEVSGSGPPLVIAHGLFGSGSNWRSIARSLAGTNQVFCVDLRNHGASPWADSMDYLEMAEDLRRFIESHSLKRPALMGHSMGGKTAMALALQHPSTIGRLIVVDIAPMPYADTMTPFAQAMKAPEVLAAASRTEAQRRLQPLLPDPAVAPFLLQNLVLHNDHFDWRINLPVISAALARLSDFPAELRALRFDRAVTSIVGERSDYVPVHDGSLFAPMFGRVRTEVIAAAGHWVHADQPQAFVAAVQRALGNTPAAATA
jgi:pimeloyl-ACP methyl ester carboxylesterase